MIEWIGTTARMCEIVAYNGVAYLCGQVGAGETVAEQTRNCLAQVVAFADQAWFLMPTSVPSDRPDLWSRDTL